MDKTSTVQRSLYYYDLYALNKNDKTGKYKKSCSVINNFLTDLKEKQDKASDYSDFLKPARNSDSFFVIIDSVENTYIKFRIVLCRNDALPFIEKGGKLESLGDYIDSDQSIAEITHCVYFLNMG